MEKSCKKCARKASLRPFFTFGKYLKTASACKKLFQKYFERGSPKSLKKVNFIFSYEHSPF